MILSDIDRRLLENCLAGLPRSWEDFSDRFLGLVLHVINHTAQSRSINLSDQDREDLAAEVFFALIENDFAVLRRFRGDSSLATYLTVVSRRIVVRQLSRRSPSLNAIRTDHIPRSFSAPHLDRINDQEEVAHLMSHLNSAEAEVIKMYHLEGKTYREISEKTGVPENSIGPTLSRARSKMKQASAEL